MYDDQQDVRRYLKLCDWLRLRYLERDDKGQPFLTTHVGGKPTRYQRLGEGFFKRYILGA